MCPRSEMVVFLSGNDATSIVNCLHILGQTLDARSVDTHHYSSCYSGSTRHMMHLISEKHFVLHFVFRTVMKTGQDSVKAALRAFFDNASEDLEKTMENLRQGQFTHTRMQPKGVTQIINYTTVALLPVLSSLFEHIGQNLFGEDLICESTSF